MSEWKVYSVINRVFASPLDEGKFSPNSSGDIQVIYICNIEYQVGTTVGFYWFLK